MKLDSIAQAYKTLYESANNSMLYESILFEDRVDYLKSKWPTIDSSHDTGAVHRNASDIVDFMANTIDPTKKKTYTQWLVNRYHGGSFRQEDAPRINQALSDFEQHKHHLPVEQRDIGRYKRVSDIQQAVAPFTGKTGEEIATKKMELAAEKPEPGFVKHYEDPNIKIHELTDEETSKRLFGRPRTEWCTAWEGNSCRFNKYTKEDSDKGPLFVVTRKHDNALFQYHPTSNQFMDKNDDPISDKDFATLKPSLHKAWSQNRHLLSMEE